MENAIITSDKKTGIENLAFVKKLNVLYEALKQYPIADLAPVQGIEIMGK